MVDRSLCSSTLFSSTISRLPFPVPRFPSPVSPPSPKPRDPISDIRCPMIGNEPRLRLRLRLRITNYEHEEEIESPISYLLSPISYLLSSESLSLLTSCPCSGIVPTLVLLGGRPMVGLRTLDPPIGVRIPASQPLFSKAARLAAGGLLLLTDWGEPGAGRPPAPQRFTVHRSLFTVLRRHDAALDLRGARRTISRSAVRRATRYLGARVPRESKAQTCLRTPNRQDACATYYQRTACSSPLDCQ